MSGGYKPPALTVVLIPSWKAVSESNRPETDLQSAA